MKATSQKLIEISTDAEPPRSRLQWESRPRKGPGDLCGTSFFRGHIREDGIRHVRGFRHSCGDIRCNTCHDRVGLAEAVKIDRRMTRAFHLSEKKLGVQLRPLELLIQPRGRILPWITENDWWLKQDLFCAIRSRMNEQLHRDGARRLGRSLPLPRRRRNLSLVRSLARSCLRPRPRRPGPLLERPNEPDRYFSGRVAQQHPNYPVLLAPPEKYPAHDVRGSRGTQFTGPSGSRADPAEARGDAMRAVQCGDRDARLVSGRSVDGSGRPGGFDRRGCAGRLAVREAGRGWVGSAYLRPRLTSAGRRSAASFASLSSSVSSFFAMSAVSI